MNSFRIVNSLTSLTGGREPNLEPDSPIFAQYVMYRIRYHTTEFKEWLLLLHQDCSSSKQKNHACILMYAKMSAMIIFYHC